MNESILVGLVVGAGVAAVGAFVGHLLRLKEMKEQWAEDEKRRKSDHRRHLLERELATVTELIDLVLEGWSGLAWWAHHENLYTPATRAELGRDAYLMVPKANMAALSLDDQELSDAVGGFVRSWMQCNELVNGSTGKPPEGREEEFEELQLEMRGVGADVRRRIRQLLEEA